LTTKQVQILQPQVPLWQLEASSLEAFSQAAFSPLTSLQFQQETCYAPFSHCFEPLFQAQQMKDEPSSLAAS
jgi:hypothetical protein